MNTHAEIGHNSQAFEITIEARLFNSLTKFSNGGGAFKTLSLPAGSTVGDLIRLLAIPTPEIFLVMRNGRDITPSLYGGVNTQTVLNEDDVIAFSGPVPYSWGYGSAIV